MTVRSKTRTTPTKLDHDKLAKVLGMLGSAHDGEIAAAGRAANKLIRTAGITWSDALCNGGVKRSEPARSNSTKNRLNALRAENTRLQHEIELLRAERAPPEWRDPVDEDEQIKLCMDWRAYLDDRDRQFIISVVGERRLDRRQAAELWGIVLKLRTIARRLGRTT